MTVEQRPTKGPGQNLTWAAISLSKLGKKLEKTLQKGLSGLFGGK